MWLCAQAINRTTTTTSTSSTLARGQLFSSFSGCLRSIGGSPAASCGPLPLRRDNGRSGPLPPCAYDRKRNLRKFEESLFNDSLVSGSQEQQVMFLLLDGSMATLNTGITTPTDLDMALPAVKAGQELEFEGGEGAGEEALWLASYFRVLATNGLDDTRRLLIDGFYQNLEYLAESIHLSIAKRGGEINSIVLEEEAAGQPVVMNVIVPFLFGVPAERSRLCHGIEKGGGIIHSEKLSVLVGLDG
jgi:hypothetical protein